MAIQVNGTTVIDNSRALNNITSVDATTAAAIGNAGVGGGLVDLGYTSVSSDVSYVQYTFPTGYKSFRIFIDKWQWTGLPNAYDTNVLCARLTNSSNSILSGSYNYLQQGLNNGSGIDSYDRVQIGPGTKRVSGSEYGYSFLETGPTFIIDIEFPRDSTKVTQMHFSGVYRWVYSTYANSQSVNGSASIPWAPAQHNAIRFFYSNSNIASTSNGYHVWGIK